jgi:hypothetical protein
MEEQEQGQKQKGKRPLPQIDGDGVDKFGYKCGRKCREVLSKLLGRDGR